MELRLLTDADYAEEFDIVSDELIDQYANEQLTDDERKLVERFISESEARRDKLRFALALKKRTAELKNRKRHSGKLLRVYLPIAASIVIVTGLSYGVWRTFFYQSDVDKGLNALRTAYGEQRPVEARVTDFNYAPMVRGSDEVDSPQRDLAARLLMSAVTEHPDALSHRALGQYYIVARQFDKAIEQLKASLSFDPRNAKTHSDLGVALLEHGKEAQSNNDPGRGLQLFGQSLEHLRKALELDESLLEARFNLALLLQRMGLQQPAEEGWRNYLQRDANSGWADEARENLRVLEENRQKPGAQSGAQALEDFLQAYRIRDDEGAWRILGRNREAIAGRFIPARLTNAYLEHAIGGRTEDAASMLDALDYAGELEARKAGDKYTAEVSRFYKSFPSSRLDTLAEAHSLVAKGYEHCGRSEFVEAADAFSKARRTFASLGDETESAFVDYWLAYSYFHSNRTDKSRSISHALIRYCEERGYKWLLAQALNLLSNIQTGFHEHSAVLALTREALSLSEQVNDNYGVQKHQASLAGKYGQLYNFPEALNYLGRCLMLAGDFWPGTRQAWRNFDTAAQVFDLMGLYSASAAYGEEALRLAMQESRDPSLIYLSHVRLGMAYGHLQNYAEGLRYAQTGFAIGRSLKDEVVGRKIMAYSALQLGEIHRQRGDFKEAARSYDQAIELYDQLAFQTFSVVAHKGRLLTYLAQNDDAAVERELHIVLDLFEEYRAKVKEEANRTYFFDVAQDIYDAAIDFAHSRVKNEEEAFAHSENSRARSLLVTMLGEAQPGAQNPAFKPYSLREIQERMPEQVQILQYAVLRDKLLIWVISKSHQLAVTEKKISHETLSEQARNYLSLVTRPSSDAEALRRASTTLYETLISPVVDQLHAGKTLCIVPDKILNHLPFAALTSPTSGRYLIQDHAIFFSPSSSVFVINSDVARGMPAPAGERLLSVGNPSFDRKTFDSLPDLPSSATEAEEVARYYDSPSPLILTGGRARKEPVIRAMRDADVLHLASHYVVDERVPMRSQLLLAKPDSRTDSPTSSDGSLLAMDIYNMKLRKPRLAVLSACRTGVERYYNGEGMIGMARTFLGAGVPLVVASQWPVDTVSTSGLMVKFHAHRRGGGGHQTVEALKAAQLEIINNPVQRYRHPYFWAAFVAIGGYTDF